MKKRALLCMIVMILSLSMLLSGCGLIDMLLGKGQNELDRKFSGNFVVATEEQKQEAVAKVQKLVDIEEAVKRVDDASGNEVTKSNMEMTGTLTYTYHADEGYIEGSSKSVERYDFSKPGAVSLWASYNMQMKGEEYGGQKLDFDANLEMSLNTDQKVLYMSRNTKSGVDRVSVEIPDANYENLVESLSGNGSFTISEILQAMIDEVALVSVDGNGKIKVELIDDENFSILTYVVVFENDHDYSARKVFETKDSEDGKMHGEIVILPTSKNVSLPVNSAEYRSVDQDTINEWFTELLSGALY